jgi:hypothetical protein
MILVDTFCVCLGIAASIVAFVLRVAILSKWPEFYNIFWIISDVTAVIARLSYSTETANWPLLQSMVLMNVTNTTVSRAMSRYIVEFTCSSVGAAIAYSELLIVAAASCDNVRIGFINMYVSLLRLQRPLSCDFDYFGNLDLLVFGVLGSTIVLVFTITLRYVTDLLYKSENSSRPGMVLSKMEINSALFNIGLVYVSTNTDPAFELVFGSNQKYDVDSTAILINALAIYFGVMFLANALEVFYERRTAAAASASVYASMLKEAACCVVLRSRSRAFPTVEVGAVLFATLIIPLYGSYLTSPGVYRFIYNLVEPFNQ